MSTQLDYLDAFLEKLGTISVDHAGNKKTLKNVGGGNKIHIGEPQVILIDHGLLHYTYRHKLLWIIDTEANWKTIYELLLTNIKKLNERNVIAGYTRPSALLGLELEPMRIPLKRIKNKWKAELYIRIKWSGS